MRNGCCAHAKLAGSPMSQCEAAVSGHGACQCQPFCLLWLRAVLLLGSCKLACPLVTDPQQGQILLPGDLPLLSFAIGVAVTFDL